MMKNKGRPSEPIKTLYMLDDPGKDKHVHSHVLRGLVEAGIEPVIGYFYGDPKDSVMAQDGISAFGLGLERAQFRGLNLRAVRRLKALIGREGFKVVHCQRHRALIHAGLALPGTKGPSLFYTVRSTNVLRNLQRRLGFRLISKRLAKVICVSKAVCDYMKKMAPYMPESKFVIIRNGVDLSAFEKPFSRDEARRFLGIPEDGFYFGIIARLKKAKCHDCLLRAFKEVVKTFPESRLAIVGDGPLLHDLKKICQELGLLEKVFFTGKVEYDQVALSMRAFDCFVHPSFREGLPVAVLEAMASNLPVITTWADGIRDIFELWEAGGEDSEIGKMVAPRNVEGLASAMIEYRNKTSEELSKIGTNARRCVEKHFSKEKMVDATVSVYEETLGKSS